MRHGDVDFYLLKNELGLMVGMRNRVAHANLTSLMEAIEYWEGKPTRM